MLKCNVGMSRKLSKDFNSTGFSVNLEGEICADPNDPEAVIERVKEIYDLVEESLAQQIERYEGESAIATRDQHSRPAAQRNGDGHSNRQSGNGYRNSNDRNGNGNGQNGNGYNRSNQSGQAATNKQIQYMLSLGKREGLSKPQLENRVAEILGREIGLYDLSKEEAGTIIENLTAGNNSQSRR